MPPKITDGTVPSSLAATPLSKAPSSLEEPMKRLFTAETRPIISWGVNVWTSVLRSTTETASSDPPSTRMAADSQ